MLLPFLPMSLPARPAPRSCSRRPGNPSAARDFYPGFDESARTTVELLRTEAGRDPFNPSLTSLIGDLSTRSEEFRALWAAQNVRLHRSGIRHFRHPAVDVLDLMFEAMALEADEGLTLTAYTAEPGTPPARRAQAPRQPGRYVPGGRRTAGLGVRP